MWHGQSLPYAHLPLNDALPGSRSFRVGRLPLVRQQQQQCCCYLIYKLPVLWRSGAAARLSRLHTPVETGTPPCRRSGLRRSGPSRRKCFAGSLPSRSPKSPQEGPQDPYVVIITHFRREVCYDSITISWEVRSSCRCPLCFDPLRAAAPCDCPPTQRRRRQRPSRPSRCMPKGKRSNWQGSPHPLFPARKKLRSAHSRCQALPFCESSHRSVLPRFRPTNTSLVCGAI